VEQAAFAWGHGAVENEPFPKRCRYPAMPASRTSSCVTPCHPTDRDYSGRASHSWDLGAAAPDSTGFERRRLMQDAPC
jgi:hypothetical protein